MAITFIPSITVKTDSTFRTVQTFEDLLQDINARFGADHDMVITKISTREEYSNSTVETYSVVGMVGKVVEVSSINLAYFDDYRAGLRVVYKTCDGFKQQCIFKGVFHHGFAHDFLKRFLQKPTYNHNDRNGHNRD